MASKNIQVKASFREASTRGSLSYASLGKSVTNNDTNKTAAPKKYMIA